MIEGGIQFKMNGQLGRICVSFQKNVSLFVWQKVAPGLCNQTPFPFSKPSSVSGGPEKARLF